MFHVGDVVRKLRREKNWSLEQLADQAHVNKGTLSALERGEANYRRETIDKIATALGTTADDLVGQQREARFKRIVDFAIAHGYIPRDEYERYEEQLDVHIANYRVELDLCEQQSKRPNVRQLLVFCSDLNDAGIAQLVEHADLMTHAEKYRGNAVASEPTRRTEPPPVPETAADRGVDVRPSDQKKRSLKTRDKSKPRIPGEQRRAPTSRRRRRKHA